MALTLINEASIRLDNATSTPESASSTIDLGTGKNVFIMCNPSQVNSPPGYGDFGQAQVFITEYVKDGESYPNPNHPGNPGPWQFQTLENVTQVKFTLTVANASVQAVGLVFAT
jgi:hypothetical protein